MAAIGATAFVLLTWVHAASQRGAGREEGASRGGDYAHEVEVAAGSERCALYHARFGGQRAQLVRVMQGSVPNYIVIEVGKRDPRMRSLRSNWLRSAYGDAEPVWLGEYGSAEAAMTRALKLCPPDRRCWPQDVDCGPQAPARALTPTQVFFGSWPPAVAPAM